MSEYEGLVEGYSGLGDPADDPGPLSVEEERKLESSFPLLSNDEPPHEEDDWPEEEEQAVLEGAIHADIDTVPPAELRVLKPDQRPQIGQHYVIYGGVPRPVIRESLQKSEDEFVREQLSVPADLKDIDGQRQQRADRTLRQRYRGYLCGEMNSL